MSVMAARVMRRRVGDELFVVARVRGLTILRVRSKDRTSSAASRSVAPDGVTMPNSGKALVFREPCVAVLPAHHLRAGRSPIQLRATWRPDLP
ncbi:hypothetical protein QA942_36440 [Streptomyces sp. B21-106]|uniref:hypothetical protein n=1 Tax=unclassified Streptomyces TaxID=2593676 RepID=UPI002FF330E4